MKKQIKLTPTQIKLKKVLKPIVESILRESKSKRFIKENVTPQDLKSALDGYLEAALWTEEENLEGSYYISDFSTSEKQKAITDINKFFQSVANTIPPDVDFNLVGHDLWLSRNGHGSGFFDADYLNDDLQKAWQNAAGQLREIGLVDEGGQLYFE